MLISVNWLRDFVDLPGNLDVAALAERFTMTCAEVEGVERVSVEAKGLIAARVVSLAELPGTRNLRKVVLDVGGDEVTTVSAAPVLRVDQCVIFAPPGARTNATGKIGTAQVAGQDSTGMILDGASLGIPMAEDDAIFCPPSMVPGEAIPPEMLDDWVIEVDNKSITHRPDLWGHYGIAREVAAILDLPLKAYQITPLAELSQNGLPEIPIEIDDAARCPRYSGLRIAGVGHQPAPLWMQVRLGHVGMRPIDCLVDLSNYIMAELGQPTHAFDGDKLTKIEVGLAKPGEKFTTLDGVERTLPDGALMIQNKRHHVALAGIMGGLETEVSDGTQTILLESANFEPAGIRRCATALGLRTEASARFEKSLDPVNTVQAIQRFVYLAQQEFPNLELASTLSDCYPKPADPIEVEIDPTFVRRFMGHEVSNEEMAHILTAIGFDVQPAGSKLKVGVPSYRATKDIGIEADIIEEVARYVGYDNIDSRLPDVTVRHFPPNTQHVRERETLRALCRALGYCEVHLYIWLDDAWLKHLNVTAPSTIDLRNPAASGQETLRHSLIPGMLAAADRNRLHLDGFKLCEVGSVFTAGSDVSNQRRNLGMIVAQRGKNIDDELFATLKGDVETWAWRVLGTPATFVPHEGASPAWAHEHKTAGVSIGGIAAGTVSVVPLALRREMDEHLASWGIAWAEIDLGVLASAKAEDLKLKPVPEHPEVELDFSMLVPATDTYGTVNGKLATFVHPLLRRINYVTAYEGKSVPQGKRSLTYRTRIGAADRTLTDADLTEFRNTFADFVKTCGYEQR
ncbi:MAG: phenylalanine--tRNA ligase subunit beta [Phycisphaerales bacterium]|nr:phenylalanine--tRNA ligase subunit beta [Phycisphaerales bacterium]